MSALVKPIIMGKSHRICQARPGKGPDTDARRHSVWRSFVDRRISALRKLPAFQNLLGNIEIDFTGRRLCPIVFWHVMAVQGLDLMHLTYTYWYPV